MDAASRSKLSGFGIGGIGSKNAGRKGAEACCFKLMPVFPPHPLSLSDPVLSFPFLLREDSF